MRKASFCRLPLVHDQVQNFITAGLPSNFSWLRHKSVGLDCEQHMMRMCGISEKPVSGHSCCSFAMHARRRLRTTYNIYIYIHTHVYAHVRVCFYSTGCIDLGVLSSDIELEPSGKQILQMHVLSNNRFSANRMHAGSQRSKFDPSRWGTADFSLRLGGRLKGCLAHGIMRFSAPRRWDLLASLPPLSPENKP